MTEQVIATLSAIEELCSGGWSHKTHLNPLTDTQSGFLHRPLDQKDMWKAYTSIRDSNGGKVNGEPSVGQPTFLLLLKAVTRKTTATTSISYFLEDALEALTIVDTMVNRLRELPSQLRHSKVVSDDLAVDATSLTDIASLMRDAVRGGFYDHALGPGDACDNDVAHCTRYGLGCCSGEHTLQCAVCSPAFVGPAQLIAVVNTIMEAIVATNPAVHLKDTGRDEPGVYDELFSMKRALGVIAMKLRAYHAHVLRGRWQQQVVRELQVNVDSRTVVIVIDYMMKVLHCCSVYVMLQYLTLLCLLVAADEIR